MKLTTNCKNCKKDFEIKSSVLSRYDLENERGRYFFQKCSLCFIDQEYHVNEVVASENQGSILLYIVGGIALFLVITIFLLSIGFIGLISLALPAYVYIHLKRGQEKSVALFNNHNISRTR